MKRKYFSALLMGALTIASVSTFTSCKDYDDDINMNTSQIKDLQEQLKTLQTALDQAKNDATTAHANFATKADLNSLQTDEQRGILLPHYFRGALPQRECRPQCTQHTECSLFHRRSIGMGRLIPREKRP
jgi:hypothetical protein